MKRKITEVLLNVVVWLNRDSRYIEHCRNEVPDWFNDTGPNRWIAEGTEQLLAVFSHHVHSGGSFGFALRFFQAMAEFKPWGPLTGAESEWAEPYGDDGARQNKRLSSVFMRHDGTAYDINARVYHDGDNIHYTGGGHEFKEVTFPYSPPAEPEIIDTTK